MLATSCGDNATVVSNKTRAGRVDERRMVLVVLEQAMTRTVAGALILMIGCSSPETPSPPGASATTSHVTVAAPPPPVPPRVWIANLQTSGGLRGGMRTVSVRSDGLTLRCSPQRQALVASAVAAAHPEAWKPVYTVTPARLTDQLHYALSLRVDQKIYQAEWDTEAGQIVPPDLRRLVDALQSAREEIGKRCP